MNTLPAVVLQSWLTRRWQQAEKFLDTGQPYSERWWHNLDEWTAAMNRFHAVEASLRRAGFTGCLRDDGCDQQAVSCMACEAVATAQAREVA